MKAITDRLTKLTRRVDTFDQRLDTLERSLAGANAQLAALRLSETVAMTYHKQRFADLEAQVASLRKSL